MPVMQKQDWPEALQEVIEFHGHVCGGLVVGYRAAETAMREVGARRADDEELVAVVENDSCAVDAVQVITGCTFGKGNLVFRDYGKMVISLWRRDEMRGVRVSRRPETRGLTPEELIDADEDTLFDVSKATAPLPAAARIRESENCISCGEPTMVTRLRQTDKGLMCIPCTEAGR